MNTMVAAEQRCPDCGGPMHLEGRKTLHFNGGRGDVLADRFHCGGCRRFYNVPVDEKK